MQSTRPTAATDKNAPTSSKKSQTIRTRIEAPDTIETLIVVPPDGGWGWMVVLTSFICNFTADGTMYTFGIFLYDISVSIGCTQTQVAFANSLMTGSYYLSGPFISALTNKFGFRVVSVLGALISFLSILATSVAEQLITVLLVYGICGGIGFGMMYIPSIIVIGFYFERWRAIATSLAVSGSSLGIICFPQIFTNLLADRHWRFKFQVLSAACLLCACFSLFYRPLYPVRVISVDEKKLQHTKESHASIYLDEFRDVTSFSKYHNLGYPTTADVHAKSTVLLAGPRRMSSASVFMNMSGPSTSTLKSNLKTKVSNTSKSTDVQSEKLKTVYEEEEYYTSKFSCLKCKSSCCCCCCAKRRYHLLPARPLYRDDIFYSGSLAVLPEYMSSLMKSTSYDKSLDYHLSVTRVTTQKDIEEEYSKCVCCPEAIKRTLATMLDCSLLKSPSFLLLSFSGFFTLLGLYTPFMFMAERVILEGQDSQTAYYLLSTLGIANTIGRLFSGIVSSFPNIKTLPLSYISLTLCGLSAILSSLSYEMKWQLAFAGIFGFTIACVGTLRSIILVEMLGLDKLTNAFGVSLLFHGIGGLAGLPISGYVKDLTGTYDASFYYAGGVILIGAVLLMPIDALTKREKRRNAGI